MVRRSSLVTCMQLPLLGLAAPAPAVTTSAAAATTTQKFAVGQSFQILLGAVIDTSKPLVPNAAVFDVDVFDTPASSIASLKGLGKRVICYFSAGTYEQWRTDASQFPAAAIGNPMEDWPGESWLDVRNTGVRAIMDARMKLAKAKGCDAVDPDNTGKLAILTTHLIHTNTHVDGWTIENGFGFTRTDAVNYIKFLAMTAKKYNLDIGLKNSIGILPDVQNVVQFAVNEACSVYNECSSYASFLNSGKPVFHIEYPDNAPSVTAPELKQFCQSPGIAKMSTVIKNLNLDGWVAYCSSTYAVTKTKASSKRSVGGEIILSEIEQPAPIAPESITIPQPTPSTFETSFLQSTATAIAV